MFLRFGFANHLSIHHQQELSFVASKLKDRTDGLIHCDASPSGSIVPALVLYGPNASGKTNLVDAIQFMRGAILQSHARQDVKGNISRRHFRLDPQAGNEVTHCEVDFLLDDMRHHYGFKATDDAFASEWLYYFPSSHRRKLFEREGHEFSFGRDLRGQNAIMAGFTRPNSLFVSTAAQNGHEYLSKVQAQFDSIQISRNVDVPDVMAIARLNDGGGIDERVINFLRCAGTGVVDYERHEIEISEKERSAYRDILEGVRRLTNNDELSLSLDEKKVIYELTHLDSDGDQVALELDQESAGTRRLLLILSEAFKAIDNGLLLVVDEFDASLHTRVCEAVLDIFCNKATNPRGAQLFATTHDTNLLRRTLSGQSQLLRRDQLWFVKSNRTGASEVYPLTDFKTRRDDNFERGYLEGRYGAVPFDDVGGTRGETQ